VKRRTALAAGLSTVAATTGCLSAVAGPSANRGYRFTSERRFFDGQIPLSRDGFDAILAATDEAIGALDWRLTDDTRAEPYRSASPPQTFLTVACAPLEGRERLDYQGTAFEFDGTFRLQYRIDPAAGDTEIERTFGYELVKWESRGVVPEQAIVQRVAEPD